MLTLENNNILPRKEAARIKKYINQYISGDMGYHNAFLSVCGLAGTGKSTMIRQVCADVKTENKCFVAHVDVSDCTTEVEIYHRIAQELKRYLEKSIKIKDYEKVEKEINAFLLLYSMIYGTQEYSASDEADKKIIESVVDVIQKIFNSKQDANEIVEDKIVGEESIEEIITTILCEISPIAIPTMKHIMSAVNYMKEKQEEKKRKRILTQLKDAFETKAIREHVLKERLKVAMSYLGKLIIVLDNFQLIVNNELGRTQSWLFQEGKLLDCANALWIIVGRNSTSSLIKNYTKKYELQECYYGEIILKGFNEEQAEQYVNEACFVEQSAPMTKEDIEIRKRMLEVCAFGETSYLPYLLNMVVNYYKKLVRNNGRVSAEQFRYLKAESEFVGYYFYMNLSDLMINAFQILSCLPEWDGFWIDMVREKFDNHLLNARNLLHNTAPIEDLGGDKFKIHEAVKDGLYNETSNYIKLDVLEYLYTKFLEIYGEKTDNGLWLRTDKISVFIEVVCCYIKLQTINEQKKKLFDNIQSVVENIYKQKSGRGVVDSGFIRAYINYIDLAKDVLLVPAVSLKEWDKEQYEEQGHRNNQLFEEPIKYCDVSRIADYMGLCFKLADLYTNNNQSERATQLERACLRFLNRMHLIYIERNDINAQFKTRHLIGKFTNAMTFDMNGCGQTEEACKILKEALAELKKLALELLGSIGKQDDKEKALLDEEKEAFELLIRMEESPQFDDIIRRTGIDYTNTLNIDVPLELKERLASAYKIVLSNGMSKGKSGDNTPIKILSQLLLVEYQKMRGNIPWYSIKMNEANTEEIWKMGLHTYWLRRILLNTALEMKEKGEINISDTVFFGYKKNMLKAYHNACVYMSKRNKLEWACIIEREVIDESSMVLLPDELLGYSAVERLHEMENYIRREGDSRDFMVELYHQCDIKKGLSDNFFLEHDQIIESRQYLGDYYLNMGLYHGAFNQLSKVLIKRYVRFGYRDNKTLDTMLRYIIAAVGSHNIESVRLLREWVDNMNGLYSNKYIDEQVKNKQNAVLDMCNIALDEEYGEELCMKELFCLLA
ncbi:MAG: hypothetical protein IJP29_01730 [Lachnospiraceae bacterium]|nr:hypothetical protein [Lachnospiraceae bacterium]